MNRQQEAQWLARRAARIGEEPAWVWLILILAVIFLPVITALILAAVSSVFMIKRAHARTEDARPVVEALLDVLKPQEVLDLIDECIKDKSRGANPSVLLSEKVASKLKETHLRRDCREGHSLGCAHRPMEARASWPGMLQEEVRKGNEPQTSP